MIIALREREERESGFLTMDKNVTLFNSVLNSNEF